MGYWSGQGVASAIYNYDGFVNSVSYGNAPLSDIGGNIDYLSLPRDFYDYQGSIYSLTSPGSWHAVQAQAQVLGGNLVTINDSGENQALVNQYAALQNQNLWIGLSDRFIDQTFQWVSSETPNYYNFYQGQFENSVGKQSYAYLSTSPDKLGKWELLERGNGSLRGIVENKYFQYFLKIIKIK
jgi:hypothetical protein